MGEVVTISGRLVDENLKAIQKTKVLAVKDGSYQPEAFSITDEKGTFKFYLESANYSLQLASQYYILSANRLLLNGQKKVEIEDLIAIAKRKFADEVKDKRTKQGLKDCTVKAYLKKSGLEFKSHEVVDEVMFPPVVFVLLP